MTLFTLPDDCVQLIFDRIPTRRLLVGRRVCRAWTRHQQLNCRRRKTLIVLNGWWPWSVIRKSFFVNKFAAHDIDQNGNSLNYMAFIEHNRIPSTEWRKLKVNYLVQTFPNVRTLIIASNRTISAHLRQFNELIDNYASQLVSLQMYFGEKIQNCTQQKSVSIIVGNWINQLNSMSALQHFTFDSPWNITPSIELPEFLTRIKEFYFNCSGLRTEMANILRKYEQEGRLEQLALISLGDKCSDHKSEQELSANQFDHWPVRNLMAFIPYKKYEYRYHKERVTSIIANFPSVTIIEIKYNILECGKREIELPRKWRSTMMIVSLPKLAHLLSPLTKLVLLRLGVEDVVILTEPLDPITTPQLKSIKALELDFGEFLENDCSLFTNQLTTFAHIFPNLRSIRVITDAQDEPGTDNLTQSASVLQNELKRVYGRESLEMTMATHYTHPFKLTCNGGVGQYYNTTDRATFVVVFMKCFVIIN